MRCQRTTCGYDLNKPYRLRGKQTFWVEEMKTEQNWREFTKKNIHKRYGCGKTDDKVEAQLLVVSLRKRKETSKFHLGNISRSGLSS